MKKLANREWVSLHSLLFLVELCATLRALPSWLIWLNHAAPEDDLTALLLLHECE